MASAIAWPPRRVAPSSRPVVTRAATVCPPEPGPDHEPDVASEAGGAHRAVRPGRVRSARDFDALRRTKHRARRGPIRVAWVPSPVGAGDGSVRVAFAVGRRVGGAVARNRLRRRLRAVCAGLSLAPGDYLV